MRYFIVSILSLISICLIGQNTKTYIKTADQFILNGYYEDAIIQYDKAIDIDPNFGEAYEMRGIANEQIGNYLSASTDFKYAANLNYNSAENFYRAGKILFQLKNYTQAIELLNSASQHKQKYHEAYLLESRAYLELHQYEKALSSASNAVDAKNTAYALYLKGLSQYYLKEYELAEENLEKAIIKDKLLNEAYLSMAEVQLQINKVQYAIENCTYVLLKDRKNPQASVIRSKAYAQNQEYSKAIQDVSRAIAIDSSQSNYYVLRGNYYQQYAQHQFAINDYTQALNHDMLNKEALLKRAISFESINKKVDAASDYSLLLTLSNESEIQEKADIEAKIYELQRENERPKINLAQPQINDRLEVMVANDMQMVEISANIDDASKIRFLKINNDTVVNLKKGVGKKNYSHNISTKGLEYLTLSAIDIYNNSSTVSYAVEHVETHSPDLSLMNPYVGDDGIITLSPDDHYLYLEGRIEDESLIQSIKIDEMNASYAPNDYNPRFTANIDVRKKNRIAVRAIDIYGNKFETTYRIQRSNQLTTDDSPMGKTWVVLIENSEYKDFANLSSPARDIQQMQQALGRYKINKVIVKRNLTKREMERFFAIDLRDLVRVNQVNSLFIWFAGHGKNQNGTGYWIPSDARMDVEFSYFNINALKASLYSYPSLTHLLVVSDACETGPAFCQALRGPIENVSCQETSMAEKRSAQVLTSAGTGYAFDNSLFTQSFVNTLLNNDDDCVSIDDIAKRVSYTVGSNSAQKPEFGRITGIKDELGTFFFMTK